jgi:hypothetical protein
MGFFGQPLAGASIAGTGPSGGNGASNTTSGSGLGLFNSPTTPSTTATPSGAGQSGGTDANGNPTGATGTQTGSAIGSSNSSTGNPTGSGQGFGGAGIIGFSPQSPKQSVLIYKKKNHYNEWEFLYDPIMDQKTATGGNTGMIGQPAGNTTSPIGGSPFGATPTTPTTPTAPTSPQQ